MAASAVQGSADPRSWRDALGHQSGGVSRGRGVRVTSENSVISLKSFFLAMLSHCAGSGRMWSPAFYFQLPNGAACFLRLGSSRCFTDTVLLGDDVLQLSGEIVDAACLQIAELLCSTRFSSFPLCPRCCASGNFVCNGAAHYFRSDKLQEPITCGRNHGVSVACVLLGLSVGAVGGSGMPPLYPGGSVRDNLPWISVSSTGLAEMATGVAEVLPGSFFSLTQQLHEGDKISTGSPAAIDDAIRSGAKSCRVMQCGAECDRDVRLLYGVGDAIGDRVIDYILSCSGTVEIKSAVATTGSVTTKQSHQLSRGDHLMLCVAADINGSRVEGVRCIVTDVVKDDELVLARMQASCDDAHLPLAADVCIMPIRAFFTATDNVLVVHKNAGNRRAGFDVFPGASNPLRIVRLVPSDCSRSAEAACWRDIEDNWAVTLGNQFENYEITGMTLFRCEERERLFLNEVKSLEHAATRRRPPDYSSPFDVSAAQKSERAALQQQVTGHFKELSQKFGLLNNAENTDVNLSVAWWGKWPAVYHGVAQNGFWKLPSHLKMDPGYFGEGFCLSQYARYSDYVINGFSMSKRYSDNGCILMCYTALGRPYPVTQDPFPPPLFTRSPPSPSSPCGKVCGAACGFSSSGGIDSHDSHYATVKMHPGAGQYFPCPLHQQPDFDGIVVFKRDRILPAAYVTFKRGCCCFFMRCIAMRTMTRTCFRHTIQVQNAAVA